MVLQKYMKPADKKVQEWRGTEWLDFFLYGRSDFMIHWDYSEYTKEIIYV